MEDDTRVWFQMYGANLNLNQSDEIEMVVDGMLTLNYYYAICEEQGLPRPNVLVEP